MKNKYNFNIDSIDIIKFAHSLKCILTSFRTHKKDTLAKTADYIDFIIIGQNQFKRSILEYLQYYNIIYRAGHLYKIDGEAIKRKGISFLALSSMDTDKIEPVFKDFYNWVCQS